MQIRRARIADVPSIFRLVKHYADQHRMLLRPLSELYETVREFVVCEADSGEIVGCGRLQITWSDLAEVKSLAVLPEQTGRGLGRALVEACLREAEALGLRRVFTLTYSPGFFEKVGFHRVDRSELPQKIWNECVRCPEYPSCSEVPLVIELPVSAQPADQAPVSVHQPA